MNKEEAGLILSRMGWLSQQPANFQSAILRHAEIVTVEPDQTVFNAGDPPSGVYGIAEGSIGVFVPGQSSGLRLATLLRSGVWFGYGPLFTSDARTLTFRAFDKASMLRISLSVLRQISLEDRASRFHLATLADQATTVAIRVIHDLLIRQTKCRIAATLMRVAGDVNGLVPRGKLIRLSQSALAEMANTSRQSVNHALRQMEDAGWIKITYEHIQIVEPAMLTNLAVCD